MFDTFPCKYHPWIFHLAKTPMLFLYIFAHVFFLGRDTRVSADPLCGGQTRAGESEEPPHPLAELTTEWSDGNYESSHILTLILHTVGADKNETLVFVHFSAQGASISIISVAIR